MFAPEAPGTLQGDTAGQVAERRLLKACSGFAQMNLMRSAALIAAHHWLTSLSGRSHDLSALITTCRHSSMSPVIILTDVHLAHASEPWRVPTVAALPSLAPAPASPVATPAPFRRNAHLTRAWIRPGTPGHEYRLGGLEKEENTGHVSADPLNHERMVALRAAKIARLAPGIPGVEIDGPDPGDLLILGWGSSWGAIRSAAEACRGRGMRGRGLGVQACAPV